MRCNGRAIGEEVVLKAHGQQGVSTLRIQMQARDTIIRDLGKDDPSSMELQTRDDLGIPAEEPERRTSQSIATDNPASMEAEPSSKSLDLSNSPIALSPASLQVAVASRPTAIIGDNEIDDLFGPAMGTDSTTTSPVTTVPPLSFATAFQDSAATPPVPYEPPLSTLINTIEDGRNDLGLTPGMGEESNLDFSAFSSMDFNHLLAELPSTPWEENVGGEGGNLGQFEMGKPFS